MFVCFVLFFFGGGEGGRGVFFVLRRWNKTAFQTHLDSEVVGNRVFWYLGSSLGLYIFLC